MPAGPRLPGGRGRVRLGLLDVLVKATGLPVRQWEQGFAPGASKLEVGKGCEGSQGQGGFLGGAAWHRVGVHRWQGPGRPDWPPALSAQGLDRRDPSAGVRVSQVLIPPGTTETRQRRLWYQLLSTWPAPCGPTRCQAPGSLLPHLSTTPHPPGCGSRFGWGGSW